MKYSNSEIDIIRKYYPNGGTKIVKKYISRSDSSIRHTAKRLKIKSFSKENQTNISDFLNIKTEKIAYLLGFIWGDGCVQCRKRKYVVSITMNTRDVSKLRYIFDNRWKESHTSRQRLGTTIQQSMFYFCHKKLVSFLEENDFTKKSFISPTKILNLMSQDLKRHFYRGWFDADGHVDSNIVVISGSFVQDWTAFVDLAKELNIKYYIKNGNTNTGKFSHFVISGSRDQIKFLYFLYNGSIFFLSRKREKFTNYLKFLYCNILDRKKKGRGIFEYFSKRRNEKIYLVRDEKRKIIGKINSFSEAQKIYDINKYQKTKDIFLLHNPENFQNDTNFYLYLEAKRLFELSSFDNQ